MANNELSSAFLFPLTLDVSLEFEWILVKLILKSE